MATVEECEAALQTIAARLGNADAATRDRIDQRSLACHITDLDVTFIGQLRDGGLHDIVRAEPTGNEVKMELTSDDLIALVDGRLNLAAAWATGRLRIHAGMRDLLKLRSFF
jgi:predicted lipid carrier protein YhbT